MARSRKFRALEKRLTQLDQDLLPAANPLGNYSIQEQDQIRAFRLLVHAEIEAFLEQSALDIVNKAHQKYKVSQRPNRILKAVWHSCCSGKSVPQPGSDPNDWAVNLYYKSVERNHGLKKDNICALFLPLDFAHGSLDVLWLNSMNSFGERRGVVAHNSFQVVVVLDPIAERATVQQLKLGLIAFDELLGLLRNCP